ncbi:MAG: LLM class flavin-dependent oxidoreductase [Chloroflexi bacterium]|nr:LLM class flavin-dependent oxidoreductase [Chloroflexota bacterium]
MDKITFGALYPLGGPGHDVADFCQKAEELGYDGVWFTDNSRGPDCFAMMAAGAAVTRRIKLGTSVFLLPLRHPSHVARTVATLDIISQGRIILGVGVGGERAQDFSFFEVPVKERGRRANEALEVMHALWKEDTVSHQGQFFHLSEVKSHLKPVQKPHPPIWVGGRGQREGTSAAVRRAAKYGDGFFPYLCSPEQYRAWYDQVKELARAQGRVPATIEGALLQGIALYPTVEQSAQVAAASLGRSYGGDFSQSVHRYAVLGPVPNAIKRLEQYIEAGARHLVFFWCCAPEDVSANMETIAREIIPRLRRQS